jgi:hypothetical protein
LGRRCALVCAMMDREGLAALLMYGTTVAHSEVQFLADFRVTREAMLTFPREGEPTLFVQFFNHVPNARRVARVEDVRWGGLDTPRRSRKTSSAGDWPASVSVSPGLSPGNATRHCVARSPRRRSSTPPRRCSSSAWSRAPRSWLFCAAAPR